MKLTGKGIRDKELDDQIYHESEAERSTTALCKQFEAMRRACSRWLALVIRTASARFDGRSTTAGTDEGSREDCERVLPQTKSEAVTIMWAAVRRGATRLELARAAVATARAVLPIIRDSQVEATAVVEASEALVSGPNEEAVKAVSLARGVLNCGMAKRELTTREDWALAAVDAAGMACSFFVYDAVLAVITVECGCRAAGADVDVASVVMASLL